MYSLEPIDEVQNHILGIISSLMNNYGLNPAHVTNRYEYLRNLTPEEMAFSNKQSYQEYRAIHDKESEETQGDESPDDISATPHLTRESSKSSWGDLCYESDQSMESGEPDQDMSGRVFVTTRREFCDTLQKGIKICPRYSTCTNLECKHFHIQAKYICPHVTRGNYCEQEACERIVIRACRKGKRCNDPECSFRHK